MNCISAGSWEEATELPKEGNFPFFFQKHSCCDKFYSVLVKEKASLGLGEKLRKAAANSAFSFPRTHLLSKSNLIVWPNLGESCVIAQCHLGEVSVSAVVVTVTESTFSIKFNITNTEVTTCPVKCSATKGN